MSKMKVLFSFWSIQLGYYVLLLLFCFRSVYYCYFQVIITNINPPISSHTYIKLKEVEDVLGGAAAWENSSETRLHAHGLPALREQASIPHADSD